MTWLDAASFAAGLTTGLGLGALLARKITKLAEIRSRNGRLTEIRYIAPFPSSGFARTVGVLSTAPAITWWQSVVVAPFKTES